MKLLYLTAESYSREPIIESQVESLLKVISEDVRISNVLYTTFENGNKSNLRIVSDKLANFQIRDCGHIINFFSMLIFLAKHLKKFDIIHCRSDRPMLPLLIINIFYNKKILYDPRGLYGDELIYHKRYLLGFIFKFLEYFCYKKSTITIVVSHRFMEYIMGKYSINNVIVIPTFSKPVEIESNFGNFRNRLNWENGILFVYSGAFEKWQLIDKVMLLFSYISRSIPNAKFVIFSKHKTLFENAFKEFSIPKENYYIDYVSSEDLTRALSYCDYGVILRDNNIINQVASPIKIKDYLLAGLQIICSNLIGDDSDFVHRNNLGIVLDNFGKESIIQCVSAILNRIEDNKVNRQTVCELAMQHFSITEVSRKYIHVYQRFM